MPDTITAVAFPADDHQPLIKERLPGWVGHLKPAQLAQLRHFDDIGNRDWLQNALPEQRDNILQALARCRSASVALAQAMADLQTAVEFASAHLSTHLRSTFALEGDVQQMKLVRFSRDWEWSALQTEVNYRAEPLLQAALQNFPLEMEWQPESVAISGEFTVGSHNGYPRYHYQALPFSAAQFAEHCHTLDLGARYQTHLNEVLSRVEVRHLTVLALKAQMRLDLAIGQLHQPLRGDGERLLELIEADDPAGQPHCRRFSLFDVDVLDTTLISPREDSPVVLLHLPGLEDGALTRHQSVEACQDALLRRLCEPAFREQFMQFIQLDKREHFASVLQRNLTGDTQAADQHTLWTPLPDCSLHWIDSPIDDELFRYLRDRHHRRLLNEARHVAVPSADADETARQQRLHYWESLGLDALGIAAFFIPAAGQLMAAIFVVQLLDEVYEGVQAWRVGDIDAALGHVKAVALDVAAAAGTGVALRYAARFGGKFIEVLRADGTPRLWNGDLTPRQVALPQGATRNAAGQWVAGDRHFLPVDGAYYEVTPHADGQRWEIAHPSDPKAHRVSLEHNGEGAWLGSHESPAGWTRQTLLRRIGHSVEQYSDEELEVASQVAGISRDALLDVYLKRQPAPRGLLDTLQRLRGDAASEDPLQRVCEGMYRPERSTPASERLIMTSLTAEPRWPAQTRLELRAGNYSGPTLESVGDRHALDSRLILKVEGGYRAVVDGFAQEPRQDFFAALAQAMPEFNGDSLSLKGWIAERAHHNRHTTLSQIWSGSTGGWTREGGLRGGSDRPLSYPPARTPACNLISRYQRLYPYSNEESARSRINEWNALGRQPHLELRALEQRLEYLRMVLGQWVGSSPVRLQVQDALLRSWRRMDPHHRVLNLSGMGLSYEDFANFPHLDDGFGHVEELILNSNPLRRVPDALASQFPLLRCLWANAMQLEQLPIGLGEQLTVMDLSDNHITWNAESQAILEEYPALETLTLSGNPLGTPPDVSQLLELRELSLFDTNIQQFPAGLDQLPDLESVDLSANMITTLPEPLNLNPQTQQALSLEHNPLNPQTVDRIETHFEETGVDLLVSEDDYSTMLHGADAHTLACWQRLSRTLPLQYRRNLRQLSETPTNLAAPQTARRRYQMMLRWLDASPLGRQMATSIEARDLFFFELSASLDSAAGLATPQLQTERILDVSVASIRFGAVTDALNTRFPDLDELEYETVRALTLQRVCDPVEVPMEAAPTHTESVQTVHAEGLLQHLDNAWTDHLRNHLLGLNPRLPGGRDALLAETSTGEPLYPFWSDRLRLRYAADFEQLQEQASAQLAAAEQQMSEGDYLIEANRLRQQFERDSRRLLETLTHDIAHGTQANW